MNKILTLLVIGVGFISCERGSLLGKWFFDYPCPTDIEVKQNFEVEDVSDKKKYKKIKIYIA
jgi:hypothetical protein